jgi:hypothetical protein
LKISKRPIQWNVGEERKISAAVSIQVSAEVGLTGMHEGNSLHTCYFPRGKHKHQLSADRLNQEKLDRAEMRSMYFKSDVLRCFNQLVQ